jgi:hypothetical protein
MADISEWSPVDESNNQPPPNGFPEFQSPSSLNNGARAVMGAVRRWYDTVTAQLASLTTSLAGYLPLTGGVLTGDSTSSPRRGRGARASLFTAPRVAFSGATPTRSHPIGDGTQPPGQRISGIA